MTGIYGKLPAHGDFIQHNLDPIFVSVWDNWLQKSLLASQEDLQEHWLDLYLIGPIWRFTLSRGVIDEDRCWTGIMVPSVDKAGRYYPLTVAAELPGNTAISVFMNTAGTWFTEVENIVIEAMEAGWTLDEIVYKLGEPDLASEGLNTTEDFVSEKDFQAVIHIDNPEDRLLHTAPALNDFLLARLNEPVCLWWSTGSRHVPPVMLASSRLPRPVSYTAMLTGQWKNRYWNEFN
ncbi:MAG: type VI secretion system-associated protein TagF [Gammaproteobacteria bacterium]|nr:MAG: type VI secretion system-associated protein TagF [Pseudomonadota bacterium]PIE38172.1 MAG: type VI secretion system-associated protein TagF [Gammaproteobacteria bacterium]